MLKLELALQGFCKTAYPLVAFEDVILKVLDEPRPGSVCKGKTPALRLRELRLNPYFDIS